MKFAPSPIKIIASFLSAILLTEAVFAHAPEVNFWKERQQSVAAAPRPEFHSPAAATLSQFGSIRSTIKSKTEKTILHIQDVHLNDEAQKNIAGAVAQLINDNKADLIALEGAFGPVDLSARDGVDPSVVKSVADYLLREHKISGPIFTALTSGKTVRVVGIDDKQHYDANVAAVRDSAVLKERMMAQISREKADLAKEKETVFGKDLAAFDRAVEAHNAGTMPMGDYVRLMSRTAPDVSLTVETFLQALSLEREMNTAKVEAERTFLVSELVKKLDERAVRALTEMSAAFQSGRVNHAEFYSYLQTLCLANKLPLARLPAMSAYIQYVLLSNSIDGEKLARDVHEMEKAVYAALARTPAEKALVATSRSLALVQGLVDFSLTKEEWDEYALAARGGELTAFENFYKEAKARDRLMAENLQKAARESGATNIVLITGGFHAGGLRARMTGASVVSFVPRISSLTSVKGSEYLSVFTQEKTPLDKLFAGEKLFLATPPAIAPGAMKKLYMLRATIGSSVVANFGPERWTMLKNAATGDISSVAVTPLIKKAALPVLSLAAFMIGLWPNGHGPWLVTAVGLMMAAMALGIYSSDKAKKFVQKHGGLIRQLPNPTHREILQQFYFDGLDIYAISALRQISTTSVGLWCRAAVGELERLVSLIERIRRFDGRLSELGAISEDFLRRVLRGQTLEQMMEETGLSRTVLLKRQTRAVNLLRRMELQENKENDSPTLVSDEPEAEEASDSQPEPEEPTVEPAPWSPDASFDQGDVQRVAAHIARAGDILSLSAVVNHFKRDINPFHVEGVLKHLGFEPSKNIPDTYIRRGIGNIEVVAALSLVLAVAYFLLPFLRAHPQLLMGLSMAVFGAAISRTFFYPAAKSNVTLSSDGSNYLKTSEGAVSVGMSMLYRGLLPKKDDYPRIIIAPQTSWVGADGSNLMQVYFAVAANFYLHGRKTIILATPRQQKRIQRYLELGNPYELPNEGGYPKRLIDQFHREALYLADRSDRTIDEGGEVNQGPVRMVAPADKGEMVEFKTLTRERPVMVGRLHIEALRNKKFAVSEASGERHVIQAHEREVNVDIHNVDPMARRPEFGVTFLGQSGGLDSDGLTSNQIIWAGDKRFLVDVGAATVAEMMALGLQPADITYIVITHLHEDHVAGLLAYMHWARQMNHPIKIIAEPGIYKMLVEQLSLVLNKNAAGVFDIEFVPLLLRKTLTLGKEASRVVIVPVPAFHGTPTIGFRLEYQGKTIAHSSDTAFDPVRVKKIIADEVPDTVRSDLRSEMFFGRVFGKKRGKELLTALTARDEHGKRPVIIIHEAGTAATAESNNTNHTSPFSLAAAFPKLVRSRLWANHTGKLPEAELGFRLAPALFTVDKSPSKKTEVGIDVSLLPFTEKEVRMLRGKGLSTLESLRSADIEKMMADKEISKWNARAIQSAVALYDQEHNLPPDPKFVRLSPENLLFKDLPSTWEFDGSSIGVPLWTKLKQESFHMYGRVVRQSRPGLVKLGLSENEITSIQRELALFGLRLGMTDDEVRRWQEDQDYRRAIVVLEPAFNEFKSKLEKGIRSEENKSRRVQMTLAQIWFEPRKYDDKNIVVWKMAMGLLVEAVVTHNIHPRDFNLLHDLFKPVHRLVRDHERGKVPSLKSAFQKLRRHLISDWTPKKELANTSPHVGKRQMPPVAEEAYETILQKGAPGGRATWDTISFEYFMGRALGWATDIGKTIVEIQRQTNRHYEENYEGWYRRFMRDILARAWEHGLRYVRLVPATTVYDIFSSVPAHSLYKYYSQLPVDHGFKLVLRRPDVKEVTGRFTSYLTWELENPALAPAPDQRGDKRNGFSSLEIIVGLSILSALLAWLGYSTASMFVAMGIFAGVVQIPFDPNPLRLDQNQRLAFESFHEELKEYDRLAAEEAAETDRYGPVDMDKLSQGILGATGGRASVTWSERLKRIERMGGAAAEIVDAYQRDIRPVIEAAQNRGFHDDLAKNVINLLRALNMPALAQGADRLEKVHKQLAEWPHAKDLWPTRMIGDYLVAVNRGSSKNIFNLLGVAVPQPGYGLYVIQVKQQGFVFTLSVHHAQRSARAFRYFLGKKAVVNPFPTASALDIRRNAEMLLIAFPTAKTHAETMELVRKAQILTLVAKHNKREGEIAPLLKLMSDMKIPVESQSIDAFRAGVRAAMAAGDPADVLTKMVGATYLYPSSSDYFAMLPKEKILYFNSQFDGKLLSLTVERNTNNEFILNIYGAGKSPALLLRLHWDPKRREFLQTVAVVDRMDRRAPRLDTTTLPVPDTRLLKEKYTLDEAMQLTGLKHRNKGRAVLERLMERGAFTYHNGNITRDEMGLLLRIAGKLNNEEYLLRHLAYLILDLPEVTHEASDKNAGERNRIRSLIMNNPAIYIPGSPHFAETKQVSREDAFFIWAEKELVDRAEPFLPGPQASKIVGLQGPSISPFKSDMPQTADGRSVWIMVGREAYFREDALNAWVREVYKSNAPLPKEPTFLSKTLQREATRRSGDQGPALAKMEAMRLLGLSANQERNFARYFQATSDGKPLWIEKRGVRLYLKGNLEAWRREMLALSDREVATVFRNRHNAVRKMVMQICSAYQGPDRRAFLSFELLAALSLPGTVFLAATHPLAFWGMVLSLVMVGAVVAHNGFKKFESAEHLFHPEERHLTVPNGQGGFSIRPEFQALLGNIDENTISIKTFPLLPIVAAYVPHRAHRHSAWQMINKKSDCPLCGLLFNKEKHSIEVGDDFVVVPEEFPYLGETGTIVKIKHQEPQIDFDLVRSMLQTLYELGPFGFRVGYNHRGAGQKITHQSYRVFPQKMPIENAASTPFLEYQGVTIRRIVDFPIRGFIIEAHSFERLLDELYRVESLLELLNTPFNLLMTESNDGLIRVFVMLRTNADVPVREFDGKIFGMMEAAGMALFEKKDEFMMPDLEEKLKEAYQHVTPTAEDEEAIAYTYRAHAAVARYATAHNVDYEVDLGGNVFYVFTIDAINEVLKFFRLPSGFSGNRSYQWADFFVQGFRLVLSRLGAVYTPTKAVKITSDARIEAIRPGEEPEYIVQKMVPGESVHDQMNTLLSAQPIDADKVIALYEKYIDFHVRLISAGVFDYDVLKSQINVKGETDLIGFDISHLRSVRSGLNVFGPGGYAEEWEDLFVEHINEVSQRHPELAARLKERFRGFSWKNEFERAGRAIPATMDETQAVPMKEWTSELETAPETAAEKPSPKDTTVLLLNRLRNRGLGTKRRILGKAAHFVSPAIAGFRNVVGTYMPLFQMRSKSDWGVVSYKNMEMAVDYHAMTGQNVIQLPPIRPSSAGNSPYSVNSSKAIEDLYIGVDGWMNELVGRGIVIPGWGDFREGINDRIKALRDADTVDYDAVRQLKKEALQFIWAAFRNDTESSLYKEFERFQDENKDWLSDVMLYFTLKEKSIEDEKKAGVKWDELRTWDWRTWLPALRDREPAALAAAKTQFAEEILFRSYMQFIAHRQLRELLAHGRRRGVQFVADIPFAVDGEDIYANPAVFGLEKNATGKPYARKTTQGVGAESSFPLGQYWLFYPFDWMYRATLGFIIGMLEFTSRIASYIRYDHVLGFYRTYHYSVDPHQSLSLESGGIYDEVLALRNRVFAASNHQERLRIAGEAFALFQSVFTKRWKTLPKELQRLLADNAIPLAFDESGTLLPDNMIRIIRPMSEDEKKMGSASGPGWKYEKDVENLVYGGPLHVKFIRLSPAQETGDFNHEDPLEQYAPMLTYMSGEEIRPTDGIGLAYYELNPRAEEYLTEILRVSQARGLVSIWELLGNLPKAVLKSTIELGGFNFLPAIWGEKRFHGSSPNPFHVSNHVENALVTGSLHDSETLRNRWEVSLNNEDGLNAKTEWLNENLGASQWGENELRNFTPVVHEKLLETIYSSPARIAIVNWLDILNLSEDYRINTPGFLGQWTKRVPTDVTLEDLWGAARGFESASPRAVEATALLRRLIEKGHRKTAPPHQGEVKIQSTVPATGGPMIQIRRLEVSGHPYDVDAYTRSENNSPINGVNLVIHLKNGKTTVVPMSPVDIDPSSHAHGLPADVKKWTARWYPTQMGITNFTVEIADTKTVSRQGTFETVGKNANLNPLSPKYARHGITNNALMAGMGMLILLAQAPMRAGDLFQQQGDPADLTSWATILLGGYLVSFIVFTFLWAVLVNYADRAKVRDDLSSFTFIKASSNLFLIFLTASMIVAILFPPSMLIGAYWALGALAIGVIAPFAVIFRASYQDSIRARIYIALMVSGYAAILILFHTWYFWVDQFIPGSNTFGFIATSTAVGSLLILERSVELIKRVGEKREIFVNNGDTPQITQADLRRADLRRRRPPHKGVIDRTLLMMLSTWGLGLPLFVMGADFGGLRLKNTLSLSADERARLEKIIRNEAAVFARRFYPELTPEQRGQKTNELAARITYLNVLPKFAAFLEAATRWGIALYGVGALAVWVAVGTKVALAHVFVSLIFMALQWFTFVLVNYSTFSLGRATHMGALQLWPFKKGTDSAVRSYLTWAWSRSWAAGYLRQYELAPNEAFKNKNLLRGREAMIAWLETRDQTLLNKENRWTWGDFKASLFWLLSSVRSPVAIFFSIPLIFRNNARAARRAGMAVALLERDETQAWAFVRQIKKSGLIASLPKNIRRGSTHNTLMLALAGLPVIAYWLYTHPHMLATLGMALPFMMVGMTLYRRPIKRDPVIYFETRYRRMKKRLEAGLPSHHEYEKDRRAQLTFSMIWFEPRRFDEAALRVWTQVMETMVDAVLKHNVHPRNYLQTADLLKRGLEFYRQFEESGTTDYGDELETFHHYMLEEWNPKQDTLQTYHTHNGEMPPAIPLDQYDVNVPLRRDMFQIIFNSITFGKFRGRAVSDWYHNGVRVMEIKREGEDEGNHSGWNTRLLTDMMQNAFDDDAAYMQIIPASRAYQSRRATAPRSLYAHYSQLPYDLGFRLAFTDPPTDEKEAFMHTPYMMWEKRVQRGGFVPLPVVAALSAIVLSAFFPAFFHLFLVTVGVTGFFLILKAGPNRPLKNWEIAPLMALFIFFPTMAFHSTFMLVGVNASWFLSFGTFVAIYSTLVGRNVRRRLKGERPRPAAAAINSMLAHTPLDLGVRGKTLKEALHESPVLQENGLDMVFIDPYLEQHLPELMNSLHPERHTVIVADSAHAEDALAGFVHGRRNITVVNGYSSGIIIKSGGIHLAELEKYFARQAVFYPLINRVMKSDQGINVISSSLGSDFVFDGLADNSMFVRKSTNYLIVNELLEILHSFKAEPLERMIKGGWAALIAA